MEFFFPVSGVRTNILLPPLVAMAISFFTSMGGVSGAFLLLPFQMSVLGYTAPSVSGTNHVYNIVAIPGGVYRYIKEGRMTWPLTFVIIAGTLPGVFVGYLARVFWLPDPGAFKLFAGCVLLFIGIRLLLETLKISAGPDAGLHSPLPLDRSVRTLAFNLRRVEYEFGGERFSFGTPAMFLLSLVVGVVGGAYGIGGGAIIAPFAVAIFRLPVYTVAGAALMGTCITSIAGAALFSLMPSRAGITTSPDWLLGILFGLGGLAGVYLGARAQRFVPQRTIKLMLGIVILSLAIPYILQFFRQ